MDFSYRQTSKYTIVEVEHGDTKINLGVLDDTERDELAVTLVDAAFIIGPREKRIEWFTNILSRCGISPVEIR